MRAVDADQASLRGARDTTLLRRVRAVRESYSLLHCIPSVAASRVRGARGAAEEVSLRVRFLTLIPASASAALNGGVIIKPCRRVVHAVRRRSLG
ncbi:hypothetical protein B0H14DRAFT_3483793 [Mycena olivaceomarginata]|nr:hypothetical protein B0H14DRAFT_3483793 [Mycena olivaceomarginata]